jgi:hypothetical protein
MTSATNSPNRLSNEENLDLVPQISDIAAERDEEKTLRRFGTSMQAVQNRKLHVHNSISTA